MRNSTAYEKSQIPKYSYSEPFIFFTLKDILVIVVTRFWTPRARDGVYLF
jgi:hypothetical protein